MGSVPQNFTKSNFWPYFNEPDCSSVTIIEYFCIYQLDSFLNSMVKVLWYRPQEVRILRNEEKRFYQNIWERPVHDFRAPVGELERVERLVGVGDVDVDAAQDQTDARATEHVAQDLRQQRVPVGHDPGKSKFQPVLKTGDTNVSKSEISNGEPSPPGGDTGPG